MRFPQCFIYSQLVNRFIKLYTDKTKTKKHMNETVLIQLKIFAVLSSVQSRSFSWRDLGTYTKS